MREILLATNNGHKIRELRALLEPEEFRVLAPADLGRHLENEEVGNTFAANATLKAEAWRDATGLLTLADDSGLVVDALGGEPGILSARYGGAGLDDEGRTRLVLERMRDVPDGERGARFVAAVAVSELRVETRVFERMVEGLIAREPKGSGGFGYDPIFFWPQAGKTFAELTPEEKAAVSHRGKAVRAALVQVRRH